MIDELSSEDDLIRAIYTLRQRNRELESYQSGINLEAYRNLNGVRLLESINKLFCASITCETEQEISSTGLKMAMELTSSSMGFIGLVNKEGRLKILAVNSPSWDEFDKPEVKNGHNGYPELSAYGLYGKIINDGKSLLTNNPYSHIASTGTPPGHPVIKSFLGVPLIEDGKTIGVFALANREGGYVEEDLNNLQVFVPTYLQLLLHTRSKKALREREKYFRALVTTSSEVLYRMNSDWSELLQLTTTRLSGSIDKPKRDWLQRYIHPDDQSLVINKINEAIMTKGTFELEHKVRQADKSPRWVFSRAIPLMNKKGEIIEWFGTANDITERKKTEKALLESEHLYRTLFDNTEDGFALIEPIFNDDGESDNYLILEVNRAWEYHTGLKPSDIMGCRIKDVLPQIPPGWTSVFGKIAQTGKSTHVESYNAENCKWHDLYSFKYREGQVGVLIRDITERKKIEEALHRLDRLNLVGEMAASIGHEIRNPMTAIRGFLQILQQKECYSEDGEFFNLMLEELDRANTIITEYLGMARDKKIELQATDLNQVVKKLYPMIEADANYQGIKVKLELCSLPVLQLDKSEIRQLILNLVRNGMDAMSSGGNLTIGTRLEGSETTLFVSDDGPGLEAEIVSKLGTPFLTTKENGTGLGLPICYSIAARHNARLEVETGAGGTTFMLKFPPIRDQGGTNQL